MQFEQRSLSWRAVAATLAIHALLWGGLELASWRDQVAAEAHPPAARAPLQVALVAAAPAVAAAPQRPAPAAAPAAVREAVRYYFPEEVERQLIVLRDPAADDGVAPSRLRVLQLFVDPRGRVAAIVFEGAAPPPEEAARLRAAFMQLEFLPALRQGRPVPARIRIELLPDEAR